MLHLRIYSHSTKYSRCQLWWRKSRINVLSLRWVCWQCLLLLHRMVYWHRLHQVLYVWWPDTLRGRKSKTMVTLAALYTGQSPINCVLQGQLIWSVNHVVKKRYICTKSLCCSKRDGEKAFRFETLPTTTTATRRCTILCEIFHTEQNPGSVTCNSDW